MLTMPPGPTTGTPLKGRATTHRQPRETRKHPPRCSKGSSCAHGPLSDVFRMHVLPPPSSDHPGLRRARRPARPDPSRWATDITPATEEFSSAASDAARSCSCPASCRPSCARAGQSRSPATAEGQATSPHHGVFGHGDSSDESFLHKLKDTGGSAVNTFTHLGKDHPWIHTVLRKTSDFTMGVAALADVVAGACAVAAPEGRGIPSLFCEDIDLPIISLAGEASAFTDFANMLAGGKQWSTSEAARDAFLTGGIT